MSDAKLYLLRLGKTDCYKIGISHKPCARLTTISAGAFRGRVEIVGVWPQCSSLERPLHRRYAAKRLVGADVPESGCTEWFRLTPADVKAIRTDCTLERMRLEGKADATSY